MSNLPQNFQEAMIELVATLKSLEKYSRSKSVSDSARERLREVIKIGGQPPPPEGKQIQDYIAFSGNGKKK